jgi:hypothetical protein
MAAAGMFVVLAGFASGQNNVRISGRVMDQPGAPIPGAAVRLRLAAHGAASQPSCPTTATTVVVFAGQDGTFSFPAESPQTYELKVDPPPGFRPLVKTIEVGTGPEFKAGDILLSISISSSVEIERTVVVQGIAGTSATISVDDLAKLPQKSVQTTDDGTKVTFQGVLLADVLSRVSTPTGEVQLVTGQGGVECRSTAPLYDVLVQGKNGGRAVFAWTEIDPSLADRAVYLVTLRDGRACRTRTGRSSWLRRARRQAHGRSDRLFR